MAATGWSKLTLRGFVQEFGNATISPSDPKRFCFVLGAGASFSSGIPTGQNLVRIWDKELKERNPEDHEAWQKAEGITDGNMAEFYGKYYTRRYARDPGDGYRFIESVMKDAQPMAGYIVLAHILTHTPHNVVITTNFDHLTEDSVTRFTQESSLVIGHEALGQFVSGNPSKPTVIKLHRDLLFNPKSDDGDLQNLPESYERALERIFANYHPVFIGYAGNDPSLMGFLKRNAEKFNNDEWKYPYWLFYSSKEPSGDIAEFMKASRGYCIFDCDFDRVLVQLGDKCGYQIPTLESFLDEAKRNHRALRRAFDAISSTGEADSFKNAIRDVAIVTDVSASMAPTVDFPCLPAPPSDTPAVKPAEETDFELAVDRITSSSDMQAKYRKAHQLQLAGNHDEAEALLQMLIEQEPDEFTYRIELGEVLWRRGKWAEALCQYQEAVKLKPDFDHLYGCIGTLLILLKRYDEAEDALRKAIQLDPNDLDYYRKLANVLDKLDRHEEATALRTKADALHKPK